MSLSPAAMTGQSSSGNVPRRSTPRRVLAVLLRSLLGLVIVLAIILISLFSFEQKTLRPLAEYTVERFTGRSLRIEGQLDAVPGGVVELRIGGISLANADWGSTEAMLELDKVEVSIDWVGAMTGRHPIQSIIISDGNLLFEKNEEGLSNWALGADGEQPEAEEEAEPREKPKPGNEPAEPVILPVRYGLLSNIAINVQDPALLKPLDIQLKHLLHDVDPGQSVLSSLDARVGGRPLTLDSRVSASRTPDEKIILEFEADAQVDDTELEAGGRLYNLFALEQADVQISLASPEISKTAETFGLPGLFVGKTRITASLRPDGEQHAIELAGNVGGLEIDASAQLGALGQFENAAIELAAAAPNLAEVIKLPGERSVPARAFRIDSRASLLEGRLEIDEARVELGDIGLNAKGVMTQFPNPENTNLDLLFAGQNYLDVVNMLGFSDVRGLQPSPFEIRMDLDYNSRAQQVFQIDLKLDDLDGELQGEIVGYPSFAGSKVDFRLLGQDAGMLQQLLAQPLGIEGEYQLQGRVTRTESGFDIGDTTFSAGENRVELGGKLGNDPLAGDTELALRFEGPDLKKIVALSGYERFVPDGTAKIDAVASTRDQGVQIDRLQLGFEHSQLEASGFVSLQPGLPGSRVDLSVSSDDIINVLPPEFGKLVNRGQPLSLKGSVTTADGRLRIPAVQATLGDLQVEASGDLSLKQPLQDTSFEVKATAPDLSAIAPAELIPYSLPAEPVTLSGGVGLDEKGLVLDQVKAEIASEKLQVSGSIPLDDPSKGLRLDISASGVDHGVLIPGEIDLRGIETSAYEAAAVVELDGEVLALQALKFVNEHGEVSGDISLSIKDPASFGKFNLVGKGENLRSLLPAFPPYSPAAEPFSLDAHGEWSTERLKVERVLVEIDDSQVEVRGEIGLQANQNSTGLVVSASGDNITDLGQLEGRPLPEEPFRFDVTFETDASRLHVPALDLQLGESELRGLFSYEFGEKPNIEVRLESRLVNLTPLYSQEAEPAEDAGPSAPVETEVTGDPEVTAERVIPDFPVLAEDLNRFNLTTDIDIEELRFPRRAWKNVEIDVSLLDGDLKANKIRGLGEQGELIAHFQVTPEGEGIVTRGKLEGKQLVLGEGEEIEEGAIFPKLDLLFEYDTSGASSRELAANLDGFMKLTGDEGRLNNSYSLSIFGGFFQQVFTAVNPFAEREPYTPVTCFAFYTKIEDGVATIDPGAVLQTDKIEMFARGQVDLKTEAISLRFDTAARKGLGISIGDFINPFVGVGGTLAQPRFGVDKENAMFEGGFAVATGGLSIVITNMYRRWFGSDDSCVDFAEEANEIHEERVQALEAKAEERKSQESSEADDLPD